MQKLAFAFLALMTAIPDAQAQDVAAGETVFRQCRACHAVGPDARNLVGPALNGLEGRKSGTIEGYDYSEANKKAGITWNETSFKVYIKDPIARIPGTKMQFVGVKNDKDIADLWAFLKQFKADGSK
jgi:cytochrome c